MQRGKRLILQDVELDELRRHLGQRRPHLLDRDPRVVTEVTPGLADESQLNRTHVVSLRGTAHKKGTAPGSPRGTGAVPSRCQKGERLLLVPTLVTRLTKQLPVLLLRHTLAALLNDRTHDYLTKSAGPRSFVAHKTLILHSLAAKCEPPGQESGKNRGITAIREGGIGPQVPSPGAQRWLQPGQPSLRRPPRCPTKSLLRRSHRAIRLHRPAPFPIRSHTRP